MKNLSVWAGPTVSAILLFSVTLSTISAQPLPSPTQIGTGLSKIGLGESFTAAPQWIANYIGLNAIKSGNNWLFDSDTASNGGSLILGNLGGAMHFATVPIKLGGVAQSLTDSDILSRIRLSIAPEGGLHILETVNSGLVVTTNHPQPYGYNIRSEINNPRTKAIAVFDTSKQAETFLVYGDGKVFATEITVQLPPFPDYVFAPGYTLPDVLQVEAFIRENGHLPGFPSASEVMSKGIGIGDLQMRLLESIERLSLYVIDQEKRIKALEQELTSRSRP